MPAEARWVMVLLGWATLACGATTEDANQRENGVRVLEAQFGMDCMPVIVADPAVVRMRVEYTNATSEPREWRVDGGRLELSLDEKQGSLHFPFVPLTSGLVMPGETIVMEHTKHRGSGTGTGTCGFCDFERNRWKLFVTWSIAGVSFEQHAGSGKAGCTS